MSLTATNAQVYKGTAAVTYGSGSGVSGSQLQGSATITYGGAPTSNTALSLPGTSGSVFNGGTFFPSKVDPSASNVFVEAWIYFNSASSPNTLQYIFSVSDSSTEDMGFYVNFTNQANFRVWNTGGTGFQATSTVTLSATQWTHFAGSWDQTNNKVYVFVNGVLGATVASFTGTPRSRSTSSLILGAGNGGTFFPGNEYIKDFRIVKGGIVPATSFTPSGAPFRLNVPSYITGGSTVLSLYEQYFNPSLLSLPGITGAYMDFSTVPVARVNTSTTSMFIEAWCYFNTLSGVEQYIAGVNTISTQTNDDWGLRWDSGSNKIQAYHYNVSGSVGISFSLAAPNATQWYHVAASFVIGTPGYIYLFVNGVLQNSGGTSMGGAPRYTAASTLWLGSPGNTGWGPSNVRIQDLRIVSGGTVPTATFTPGSAPFGLASPSYVSGGTTVLSLATQYYQTNTTGVIPQVFLGPTATYPAYTTTSAPVFSTSNVAFTGAGYSAGNFINFGQTTITMSLGYSIMFQFAWTGSFQPAYERILDFGVAGGNTNSIIVYRNGTASTINFGNFSGGSAQTVTSTSTFPQNTVSGTVVCVYDPSSTGSLKMYVNGSLQATLTGITIIPNGSFPSSLIAQTNATGLDPFSNVNIYSMKFYNRVLSAAEIARTASPIPYIQMTSRPVLPAVLVNPGDVSLAVGSLISVSQTALQPANGITWSLIPSGAGVAISSSTDYVLTLLITSQVSSLFTVVATNKNGLSSVVQFNVSTPLYSMTFPFTFTNMGTTGSAGPTSITYGTSNPGYGTAYAMVLGTSTSAGMQRWTVPVTRSYTFTVAGAGMTIAWGPGTGNQPSYYFYWVSNGAVGTATLSLTSGHVLRILVGQQPLYQTGPTVFNSSGGCGGTFIYNETTSTLLMVAGGGGGCSVDGTGFGGGSGTAGSPYTIGYGKGGNATTTTTGGNSQGGNVASGGTGGAGGGAVPSGSAYGAASGAGYSGNGQPSPQGGGAPTAFTGGGTGGTSVYGGNPSSGGFGGGGGTGTLSGGGGGGGYSGGGAGWTDGSGEGGGGGGSYINGSWTSIAATNTGMGYVIVT